MKLALAILIGLVIGLLVVLGANDVVGLVTTGHVCYSTEGNCE